MYAVYVGFTNVIYVRDKMNTELASNDDIAN